MISFKKIHPCLSPAGVIVSILQDIAPSNLLVRIGEYNVLNTNEPHKHIDRCVQYCAAEPGFLITKYPILGG